MLLRIIVLLSLIALCPGKSLSATEPQHHPDQVVNALERPFRDGSSDAQVIRDFEGVFVQESHLVSLDRTQRGHGRVAVKFLPADLENPRRTLFSWQYDEPERQEIISDGRTLWVYIPENRQVIKSEIDLEAQGRPGDPMSFLTGLGNLSRDFAMAWAVPQQDLAGNHVLELTPRVSSALIQKLVITVDPKAVAASNETQPANPVFPLVAVTVFDPSGNTTRIEFHDIQVNRGIETDRFLFTIPDGVEVVRPAAIVPNP